MSSEGLIVDAGEGFVGGAENYLTKQVTLWKTAVVTAVVVAFLIILLAVILPAAGVYTVPLSWAGLEETAPGSGLWKRKEKAAKFRGGREGYGNRTRQTMMPTGANPDPGQQEGSQPGAGGYGRQWDPTTHMYKYIRPEFERLDRALEASITGDRVDKFANAPEFADNSFNTWTRDAREKKGMRMYSALRQAAIAQGNEWNQSFEEWYKGWKSLPDNRLASDVYTESMVLRPMIDERLTVRAHNGY